MHAMRWWGALFGVVGMLVGVAGAASDDLRQIARDLSKLQAYLDGGGNPNAADGHGDTLLALAASGNEKQKTERVELLLRRGANPNTHNHRGTTPIHWALDYRGEGVAVIRALLEHGADPNILNGEGSPPLHRVLFKYNEAPYEPLDEELLALLLRHGAKINLPDKGGRTVLNVAAHHKTGAERVIALLLAHGADPNLADQAGVTPLHSPWLTRPLAEKLLNAGAKVNARNKNGDTPLHRCGDPETAALLAKRGADVNAQNGRGLTPLAVAIEQGQKGVALALLAAGADPNRADNDASAPLHHLLRTQTLAVSAKDNVRRALLDALLQHGANVNAQTNQGRVALHWAARFSGADGYETKALLAHGAAVQVADAEGQTPLHWARGGAVGLLIQAGADVNARDQKGNTPLHQAREPKAIDALVQHRAAIDARNAEGQTPLHDALHDNNDVGRGKPRRYKTLLQLGADVNARDNEGRTALHYAAGAGSEFGSGVLSGDRLADVLAANADVNAQDNDGCTALLMTATPRWCSPWPVAVLIEHGADVKLANAKGQTVLHLLADFCISNLFKATTPLPAEKDAATLVKLLTTQTGRENYSPQREAEQWLWLFRLVVLKGADPNAADREGRTPLHVAVTDGYVPIVKLLLAHGADPNRRDKDNLTPLTLAMQKGRPEMVALLLNAGAKKPRAAETMPPMDKAHLEVIAMESSYIEKYLASGGKVDDATDEGWTLLHLAARAGNATGVDLLLQRGAAIAAKNKDGETPLHVAAQGGHETIVAGLLAKGADVKAADRDEETALHFAVQAGALPVVKMLVKAGADANAPSRDDQACTPLGQAVEGERYNIIEFLLKHGADPNTGVTRENEEPVEQFPPLVIAASKGDRKAVALLLNNGADPNCLGYMGVDALIAAAAHGHREIAELLVARGAHVNRDDGFSYALMQAVEEEQPEMAEWLIAHGAACNVEAAPGTCENLYDDLQRLNRPDLVERLKKNKAPKKKD